MLQKYILLLFWTDLRHHLSAELTFFVCNLSYFIIRLRPLSPVVVMLN